MKLLHAVIPNLTFSMNIVLLIVIYLDMRNPKMGFLVGAPFVTLAAICCVCSIACAGVLYASWRKRKPRKSEKSEV